MHYESGILTVLRQSALASQKEDKQEGNVNWEQVINQIGIPGEEAWDELATRHDLLLREIAATLGDPTLAARLEELRTEICTEFGGLVDAVDRIDWRTEREYDVEMYAAMDFVVWYLHKAWTTIRDPLPVSYMKVLAYTFLVGLKIGRHQKGSLHE